MPLAKGMLPLGIGMLPLSTLPRGILGGSGKLPLGMGALPLDIDNMCEWECLGPLTLPLGRPLPFAPRGL